MAAAKKKTMRELRLERGWSQMKLAIELGVNLSTVSKLESGRSQPRIDLAQRVAAAFGVSLDNIVWPRREEPAEKKAASSAPKNHPAAA